MRVLDMILLRPSVWVTVDQTSCQSEFALVRGFSSKLRDGDEHSLCVFFLLEWRTPAPDARLISPFPHHKSESGVRTAEFQISTTVVRT